MNGKFIAGTFDRVHIAKPRVFTKGEDSWENYSVHCVSGIYEQSTFDGNASADGKYFNSGRKVPVYNTEDDSPIDPNIIEGKRFDGRILLTEDGKYLTAICVIGNIEDDPSEVSGNPFLSNPIA